MPCRLPHRKLNNPQSNPLWVINHNFTIPRLKSLLNKQHHTQKETIQPMNIRLKSEFQMNYLDMIKYIREDLDKETGLSAVNKERLNKQLDELENSLRPLVPPSSK